MTHFDMVVGKGDAYAGGYTASTGTSKTAVQDVGATAHGKGPSGARAAAPAQRDWACAWPEEEAGTDVRDVRVAIRVHVDRDGNPQSVDVLGGASPNFARAARRCALGETYSPARNDSGQPLADVTSPFLVHFFR
jgi:hypothetical protein